MYYIIKDRRFTGFVFILFVNLINYYDMYTITTIVIRNNSVESSTTKFVEDANITLMIGSSHTTTRYPNDWDMVVTVATRVS